MEYVALFPVEHTICKYTFDGHCINSADISLPPFPWLIDIILRHERNTRKAEHESKKAAARCFPLHFLIPMDPPWTLLPTDQYSITLATDN